MYFDDYYKHTGIYCLGTGTIYSKKGKRVFLIGAVTATM